MVHHFAGVVVVDDVLDLHRGIVATAVAIDDGTAQNFQIGLVLFRQLEAHFTLVGHQLYNRIRMILVTLTVDGVCHLACSRT